MCASRVSKRLAVAAIPIFFWIGLGIAPKAARAAEPSRPRSGEPVVNPDGYTSARTCGQCHEDIYNSWKKSLHAFSLADPIFDTAFMQAVKVGGEEARKKCLGCHAPMTMSNGDYELQEGVTREGISCDFCHTVTAVHLGDPKGPFSTDPGLVKRGIIKKAESPAHKVAFSELHGTSEFCSGCHNYTTPGGAAVLSTYDEWKAGPYSREGRQCQDCHMVWSSGKVVREEVKPTGDKIHLHDLIHDTNQLKSALVVQITNVGRSTSGIIVDVEVENVGSGHKVPTGMPTREVILTVVVEAGTRTLQQERSYRKVVADEKRNVLETDYETILHGARILNDTRIGPREKRMERFTFDYRVADAKGVKVRAALTYKYTPVIMRQQPMVVELGEAERVVY